MPKQPDFKLNNSFSVLDDGDGNPSNNADANDRVKTDQAGFVTDSDDDEVLFDEQQDYVKTGASTPAVSVPNV